MDVKNTAHRFDQAVGGLCTGLAGILQGIPGSVKESVYEVRLRVGKPVVLVCKGRSWFVDRRSQLHNLPQPTYIVTKNDVADSVIALCAYSVHSHQNEMKHGFISLRGGHRAGICGTAVTENGRVSAVREITSINLRVARDVYGVANPLMERIFSHRLCGALIVGAPSSGKTTVLRDLARQLANGRTGSFLKVAVVDERGEIGAVSEGAPQNDLGVGCDILTGYPKGEGILTAVRTLSPDVIVCDEIGGEAEVAGIVDGINCGVRMIATAHAGSEEELLGRRQILRLIELGAFQKVIWLGDADNPGKIARIMEAGDLFDQTGRRPADYSVLFDDGRVHGLGAV